MSIPGMIVFAVGGGVAWHLGGFIGFMLYMIFCSLVEI